MAREPGLETFRGALARGSRLAKRHIEPQAAIYQAVLDDLAREAAERVRVMAVVAAGSMPNPDEIYNVDEAAERINRATEGGRVAMIQDTVSGVSGVWGASFDVTNPLMANLLTGMGQKITRVAEEQRAGIMRVVQNGYDQGDSIVKIAASVYDPASGSGITSAARAAMIARTELTQATQGAGLASAQTLDISKFKQWLAAADSRTRADHSYVAGSVVKLKEAFNVNGHMMQHPGDPAGPAKETVHCRCVLVYTDNPEGLAGVPKHDDIQRQANDPEIIADDQAWLRKQRRAYKRVEEKASDVSVPRQVDVAEPTPHGAKLTGDWSKSHSAAAEARAAMAEMNDRYDVPFTGVHHLPEASEFGQLAGKSNDRIHVATMFLDDAFMAAREKEWAGLVVSPGRRGIVIHEFGHMLDGHLLRNNRAVYDALHDYARETISYEVGGKVVTAKRWQAGIPDTQPSAYGQESEYEWIAESFSDWVINGPGARASSRHIGEIIEKALRRQAG